MGDYISFEGSPPPSVWSSSNKLAGAYKTLSQAQEIIKDLNDSERNIAIRRAAFKIHERYTSKWSRMPLLQRGVATVIDGLKGAINFLFRTHLSTRHNVEELYQKIVNRDPIFNYDCLREQHIETLQKTMDDFAARQRIGSNKTWADAARALGWTGKDGDHFEAQDYVRHLLAGLIWAKDAFVGEFPLAFMEQDPETSFNALFGTDQVEIFVQNAVAPWLLYKLRNAQLSQGDEKFQERVRKFRMQTTSPHTEYIDRLLASRGYDSTDNPHL